MEKEKINRFFKGESSKQEAREVLNWIYSRKNESEIYDLIDSYWRNTTDESSNWNAEDSWNKFKQNIKIVKVDHDADWYRELKVYREKQKQIKNRKWIYKLAASVAFLVLITLAVYQVIVNYSQPAVTEISGPEIITKSTNKGQKLTIFLRDGTKIILNAESEIKYPAFFSDSERSVELKGEAFFDVAHDDTKIFKVLCDQTVTEVLGTTFNIKSISTSQQVKISLLSGKVKVNLLNDKKKATNTLELNPGQTACTDKNQGLSLDSFDYNSLLWKDGILFFDKAGFNEIIRELESWYGVDFEIIGAANLENKHYSGKFDNESLQNVLESIGFSKDFNYKITGKKVIINIK